MGENEQEEKDNVIDLPKVVDHKSVEFHVKNLKSTDNYYELEGFGSTFGNIDLGEDVVAKGAFNRSLQERKPKLLFQHDMDKPLGVIDQAFETDEGLYIKCRMPKKSALAQEVYAMLEIGALDSFSIGFSVRDQEFRQDGVRVIKEVELFEVSVVTIPMNPKAKVTAVKSFNVEDVEDIKTKRDFEKVLVESGAFSKKAALLLSSRFEPKQSESVEDEKQRESVKEAETGGVDSSEFTSELNQLLRSLSHE